MSPRLKDARILIVDDQETDIRLLRGILIEAGANSSLKSTTDPGSAVSLFSEVQPDLVVLDLHMPGLDGFAVMEDLKTVIPPGAYLPILAMTAESTAEVKQRALLGGAKDFVAKPFDATEVVLRVQNLLETRHLHVELQIQNDALETRIRQRALGLDEVQLEILQRLAVVAEFRDDVTGQHPHRVGETAALLAWALGRPEGEVELIRRAAPLHDVGKIAIPDRILLKPAKLSREEFEEMKTHTFIGAKFLVGSALPILKLAEQIAMTHHENWDGTGYPRGLEGDAIPLPGRIVAVADAYDAFTHDRPYRKALPHKETWEIMWEGAGAQWDETVLEAFASTGIGSAGERPAPGAVRVPHAEALRRRKVAASSRR